MDNTLENKNRWIAAAGTLLVHALILLLFIYVAFKTPIPPFPESPAPGFELNFGNFVEGTGNTEDNHMGDVNPSENMSVPTNPDQQTAKTPTEQVLTSDVEETGVTMNDQKKTEKQTEKVTEKTPVEPTPSTELLNALSKLKNKKSGNVGGDGNSGKEGNQGDPAGDPLSDGDGTNGQGKAKYFLKGRRIVKAPDITDDSQEQGIIVIDITVDETGKVIKAEDKRRRENTTTSAVLSAKARQAALTAKFNPSPDGTKIQYGTLTFVFVLN